MAGTLQWDAAVSRQPVHASADTSRVEHIFSVDVEEYFQVSAFDRFVDRRDWPSMPSRVEGAVDRLLELLDRHGATGTFFTLGCVAERHPMLVRQIAAGGHEIASHGWSHRRVTALSPSQFRDELSRSKSVLEDITGQEVIGFRAPSFSIGAGESWAFDVLIEEGYRYDSSVFPVRRPGYGDRSARTTPFIVARESGELLELPLATLQLLGLRIPAAGGGYLRHFPFAVVRGAVRAHATRGESAMLYVHPWEIDHEQPRLPVPALTRIRHYGGLRRTLPRLARLLGEFSFTSAARRHERTLRALREEASVQSPRSLPYAGLSESRA